MHELADWEHEEVLLLLLSLPLEYFHTPFNHTLHDVACRTLCPLN